MQRHGLLQPALTSQDHGLVAVAYLQTVLVAQLQAERFLLLSNAKRNFQFADSLSGFEATVSQPNSATALTLLPTNAAQLGSPPASTRGIRTSALPNRQTASPRAAA